MELRAFLKTYNRIALDTNAFISVFAQEPLGEKVTLIIEAAADHKTHEIITSVLAFSECVVRPYREGNWIALDQVKLMFQMPNLTVYPVNEVVAEEAARLRAVYNLKTPDAIIIATAIIYKADVLITNDYKLSNITEIPLIKLDEL
jgi:predicted nucleic acid-binding protein